MRASLTTVVAGLEITLAVVGAVLLWRLVLSPAARAERELPRLRRWEIRPSDFLLFLFLVMAGAFFATVLAGSLKQFLPFRGDAVTVFHGAAAQLGMLAGVVAYWTRVERVRPAPAPGGVNIFTSGAATFLVALPILIATAKAWETFLQMSGLPTERQDLIRMFANADSPWLLGIMIALAVVIAPLTEELVFRGGLFRYFRAHMPRWVALLAPALFFAVLHVNRETGEGLASLAPLTVLAIVFSVAYERTGHIGTPIVAHALFNLNTVLLVLSGVGLETS
jgi:membrane protease YdiL (CAAX protease family)